MSTYFNTHHFRILGIQYSAGRFFVSADTTATAQSSIYYSDDTCRTWRRLQRFSPYYNGQFCFKASGGVAYLATLDSLYSSFDNGNTWVAHYMRLYPNSPDFIDARDSVVAVFVSSGALIYSTNGGVSYSSSPYGYSNPAGVVVTDSGVYIGCSDFKRGVFMINPYTGKYDTINIAVLADSQVNNIYYGNGKIIIGTSTSGIYWVDEQTRTAHNFVTPLYALTAVGLSTSGSRLITSDA